MKKIYFPFLGFIFFIVQTKASGASADDFCKNLFNFLNLKPGPISKTDVPVDPNEVEYSGVKVTSGWKPNNLNQTYVYIIDESGGVWISPDFVNGSTTKFIASHRSLFNQKQRINDFGIVAAGQISVKNGVISSIDNQSGTFRGDASNLRFAHHILKNVMNLDIPEQVLLIDISKNPKSPIEIHESRKTLLKKFHDPKYQDTKKQWEPVLKKLHELYPDPDSPGDFNSQLYEDIWEFHNSKVDAQDKTLLSLPGYLASFTESFDHLVNVASKQPERSHKVLTELKTFLESKNK